MAVGATFHLEPDFPESLTFLQTCRINASPDLSGFCQVAGQYLKESRDNCSLLDIGCGTGSLEIELASTDILYTGVDYNSRYIDAALRRTPTLASREYVHANVQEFLECPKNREIYDVGVALAVREAFDSLQQMLRMIFTVLRKDAISIIGWTSPAAETEEELNELRNGYFLAANITTVYELMHEFSFDAHESTQKALKELQADQMLLTATQASKLQEWVLHRQNSLQALHGLRFRKVFLVLQRDTEFDNKVSTR
jgi:2-polyprenyl-3-methyl-5-hydroxy-6-metoxy-1,4-benzoquinol methylase